MSDTIDRIVMDHTAPVVGGTPVLHSEPTPAQPQTPEQPKPEPAQPQPAPGTEVQVTVKPAEQPAKN
jgi:hypothetical protein